MATKLFLDANVFIDIIDGRTDWDISLFDKKSVCVSVLSLHIACYTLRYAMPFLQLHDLVEDLEFVSLSQEDAFKALKGPTADYEDNLQLHTAIAAGADRFITRDKKLLDLGYFGALEITDQID